MKKQKLTSECFDIIDEDAFYDDYDDFDIPVNLISFRDSNFSANKEDVEKDDKTNNSLNSKNNSLSYKFIKPKKLKPGEIPLSKVIGHENQKKELLSVIEWFNNSKQLKAKGVSIPRGAILFGEPGNGKSLLIKEIIKCCNAPVLLFQGGNDIIKEINEMFTKARSIGHSIIVIDELDLLINKERRVVRALQENLDGVEENDDILVLAATNNIDYIPSPLTRNGRLEKLIRIPLPTGEEALELFKVHCKEFNLTLPEDFDEEETSLLLLGISCAGIKSVVNDIVLRNGFENITSEMIDNSIYNITDKVKDSIKNDTLEVAIHEAGHAVMASAFPKYCKIKRLNIDGASGEFHAKEVEKGIWPYSKVIADIKIAMAGIIAEKIICGEGSRGCENDLQSARISAYNMLNMCGYSACWQTLPTIQPNSRTDTSIKRRRMERKIERILKKCEDQTTRYIKDHKSQIATLGKLLFDKKHLKPSEILSCIG